MKRWLMDVLKFVVKILLTITGLAFVYHALTKDRQIEVDSKPIGGDKSEAKKAQSALNAVEARR